MMFEVVQSSQLVEWYSSIRGNAVGLAPPAVTSPDETEHLLKLWYNFFCWQLLGLVPGGARFSQLSNGEETLQLKAPVG